MSEELAPAGPRLLAAGPRLLAAGPHYYPLGPDSDIGGEIYERELLRRLPAHGIDIALGLPRDHRVDPTPEGWRVEILRHGRDLHWTRAPLVFVPYLVGLLRRAKPDILRGHSVRYVGPSLLAARVITRRRVPIVLHHHHLDPRWQALEARIAATADAVITVSEHSRAELTRHGVDPARVHVVLQGIDPPPPTGGYRDAWPEPSGLRLLSLGRLEARKRPEIAVDTLAELTRQGVDASLVIAGAGPVGGELARRAAQRGVAARTRLLGAVGDPEKWRLYDSADVLLFASTLEGFGLVVAEAQSRGLPVVAAAGTATAEALEPGTTGILTAPDPGAFARAVAELTADENRHRAMRHRARDFARRFDWDACATAVAGIYRAATERR